MEKVPVNLNDTADDGDPQPVVLPLRVQSHSGCICLTFLQCVFGCM